MNEKKRITLLLAVTVLVYANTLFNGFTMDDDPYILHNTAVTSPSWHGFFLPNQVTNLFRPITIGSFALNWAIGGDHPFGYHLVNVLLNAIVALLLYLVLRKLLENVASGGVVAWAAALLFALHPIHTESVASIVGRSELLAAAFLLGAWLLHLEDRPYLALLCFLLALLSKESAVVFVPLVFAGDSAQGKLRSIRRYAGIAVVGGAYLVVLRRIQGGHYGANRIAFLDNPLAYLPASLRILNALRIAWKYVALQVYPATLSCDYSYNSILLYANWHRTAPAVIATLLVLALWIWAFWTKKKEWFLAGAIYLIAFSVTSNLLTATGTIMAERLAYLPSAGFCLGVALIWICLEKRQRTAAWTVLGIVLLALAARTVVRNRDWRDNFTLVTAGERAVPGSAKMHAGVGDQYLVRGQLEEARRELKFALHIYPDYPQAIGLLGLAEARLGNDQEALSLFQKQLAMTPKDDFQYATIQVNLAAQLSKLRQNAAAAKILDDVIAKSPDNARAWSNRAAIQFQRGDYQAARSDAETSLRLDPANPQAQSVLALLAGRSTPIPQP
ncbi:MAG: tetratricopeptide repeat protein [Candidatus Acidiferrum sp.]